MQWAYVPSTYCWDSILVLTIRILAGFEHMSECSGRCLLSDCKYTWNTDDIPQDTILHHLLAEHKIVIANIETVYDINKYCLYWSNKITSCKYTTNSRGSWRRGYCMNVEIIQ